MNVHNLLAHQLNVGDTIVNDLNSRWTITSILYPYQPHTDTVGIVIASDNGHLAYPADATVTIIESETA
jgi:hypothetical protein